MCNGFPDRESIFLAIFYAFFSSFQYEPVHMWKSCSVLSQASKSETLYCLSCRTVRNKSLWVITIICPTSAFVNKWDAIKGQTPSVLIFANVQLCYSDLWEGASFPCALGRHPGSLLWPKGFTPNANDWVSLWVPVSAPPPGIAQQLPLNELKWRAIF